MRLEINRSGRRVDRSRQVECRLASLVHLERVRPVPDHSIIGVIPETPVMGGDIPRGCASCHRIPLRAMTSPDRPILDVSESIAHRLDPRQGLQVAFTGTRQGVAHVLADPKAKKGSLLKFFRGKQLGECKDEAASVDLRGANRGGPWIRPIVESRDEQLDSAPPPRRLRDRDRVRVVSWRPRSFSRNFGHVTVVHRQPDIDTLAFPGAAALRPSDG